MRKINFLIAFLFIAIFSFIYACKDENKSDKAEILSFSITGQIDSAIIDNANKKISILVPTDMDLKNVQVNLTISSGATVLPESGQKVDFSSMSKVFVVTAEDGSMQNWTITISQIITNLNARKINAIYINDDKQWIGTDSGLYVRIEGGYAQLDYSNFKVITSLAFENGYLWVGTTEGLVKMKIADNSSVVVDKTKLSNSSISSLYIDNNATKWIGSIEGFSMNKGETWKNNSFSEEGDVLDFEAYRINGITSWDGDYYFATDGAIYRVFGYNKDLDAFTGASQLNTPYNGNCITSVMNVAFADSKNRIWMGGTNGIQYITGHDTKKIENIISFVNDLPSKNVLSIAEAPNGNIWVGTDNGIAIYNNSAWSISSASLPDKTINAIAFEKSGKAWIGTNKGLTNIQ